MRLTLCAIILSGISAGALECRAEYPLPKNLSGDWLIVSPDFHPSKNLPLAQRLIASLNTWGEAASRNARIKIEKRRADISGEFRDNEKPHQFDIVPTAYTFGIKGGFKFFSFTEP